MRRQKKRANLILLDGKRADLSAELACQTRLVFRLGAKFKLMRWKPRLEGSGAGKLGLVM